MVFLMVSIFPKLFVIEVLFFIMGKILGIIGGGQLGMMLTEAANNVASEISNVSFWHPLCISLVNLLFGPERTDIRPLPLTTPSVPPPWTAARRFKYSPPTIFISNAYFRGVSKPGSRYEASFIRKICKN